MDFDEDLGRHFDAAEVHQKALWAIGILLMRLDRTLEEVCEGVEELLRQAIEKLEERG